MNEKDFTGYASPWPNKQQWPVVTRLLAYWRWTTEGHITAADNSRKSLEERTRDLTNILES